MSETQPPVNPNPEAPKNPTPAASQPAAPVSPVNVAAKPITRAASVSPAPAESMDRREFIKWSVVGWAAFTAVLGGYASLIMRYLFPNVLFEPKQTFRAGYPDEYQVGEVSERWKEKQAVWIVRDTEKIYVLSTVCTHLGCTPNWLSTRANSNVPVMAAVFIARGFILKGRPRVLWNDLKSICPMTARSSLTRR